MGRPRTYHTTEERKEAMRKSRRAYYYRNLERERSSAARRWNSRAASGHARERENDAITVEAPSLRATEKVLGGALSVDTRVHLSTLLGALEEDLRLWHARDGTDSRSTYRAFATTLISCKKPSQRLKKVQDKIQGRIAYVEALASLARDGDGELMRRNPRTYHNRFQQVQRDAYTVSTSLEEMLMYHREGHAKLEKAFNENHLFWQGM
ncbi:hypothetical protein EXIGLDRAFT_776947 [Exidia glandulosa HHB12029]|uniref:Uncharacterized protein n=1 Tax=Exidia glandulosa HHB12029 TaxID=1314781 RepID=A0A165D919_EXIGL|nr:hypothetical protein EXIGLDRAFT_776947 [Exidia glandulosa HHB12029]